MPEAGTIDITRPSPGRIYDFLLGGHHNFEVDRKVASRMLEITPFLSKAMRLQRWCLHDLATELTEKRGYDVVIDFASGLPTNDHIHTAVKPGTTVIYSDNDPIVGEYATEILKGTSNVYFFPADARNPLELLNRPEVVKILDGRRNLVFVHWGVALFLTDQDLVQIARSLAEWGGPCSTWAFQAQGAVEPPTDPTGLAVRKIYEQMGAPMHYRPLARFKELIQPWHPDEMGFVSLVDWHGFDPSTLMDDQARSTWSESGGNYGAYLVR